MKIIEANNRVKCECGCVMEYEKSDVKTDVTSEPNGFFMLTRDYYRRGYVECPICGRKNYIYSQYYKTE